MVIMELQLALALPSNPMKGFDLNSCGYEPKGPLGSDPLSHIGSCWSSESISDCNLIKKRSFDEAFVERQTLPLLFWNNDPNEEDDDDHNKELDKNSSTIDKIEGEEEGVVGWPPIKAWRKKLCHHNRIGSGARNEGLVENVYGGITGGNGGGLKSTYVKVKMEGVAIARKIDLSLHYSYQTLMDTLVGMFGRGQANVKAYKLAYQDRDGDWLLAGDVPWSFFHRICGTTKTIEEQRLIHGDHQSLLSTFS
ncbi:unnamed protein product [Camellia sinensis]